MKCRSEPWERRAEGRGLRVKIQRPDLCRECFPPSQQAGSAVFHHIGKAAHRISGIRLRILNHRNDRIALFANEKTWQTVDCQALADGHLFTSDEADPGILADAKIFKFYV